MVLTPPTLGTRTLAMAMLVTRTTTTRTIRTNGFAPFGGHTVAVAGLEVTTTEVYQAYLDCRRHKRGKDATTLFEMNLGHNLVKITQELNQETWQPGSSMCFVVTRPKPREVWAATFNDRVVHHVIYNRLRPRIEPKFIITSFACIKNRGTLNAVNWASKAIRQVTNGHSREAWALQLDVANFFPTIDREILWKLIAPYCYESWLFKAIKQIINQDVTKFAYFPGDSTKLGLLPKHKSLWNAPAGKGLPIGNLTSQFAANIYLNEIDYFIKKHIRPQHYGRYVDDLLLMDTDKNKLLKARKQIADFLECELYLKLHHGKTRLQLVKHGVDFVGWRLMPYRRYIRQTTVSRANEQFYYFRDKPENYFNSMNSYLGMAIHGTTWNLRGRWQNRAAIDHQFLNDKNRKKIMRK